MANATEGFIDIGSNMGVRKVREPSGAVAFQQLPVIDLADMESPDRSKREALAAKVYDACTQTGFFYVKNHGISNDSLESITGETKRFFKTLPLDEKMKISRINNEYHLGYGEFEKEKKPGARRIHQFESFQVGREAAFDNECGQKVGPEDDALNQFPPEEELPGFRAKVGRYFGEQLTFSRKLIRLFALSLNMDEDFFEGKMDRPGCMISLNYYNRDPNLPNVNASIHPHTDHELFTILYQDGNINALEVVNSDGVWVPVPPIEGTFVVNIGDALSIWTNNVFVSTLHRAVNTSEAERISIPFFFGANYDVVMDTLPSCISEARPRKYKSVTAGEHYLSKMNTAFGARTLVA